MSRGLPDLPWAFQPLRRPPVPTVANPKWVRTPIDAFILAGLEARGLAPAAPVDRRRLIRRVTLDLIGLPPSPEEADAFVRDPDPRAYEKLVDRLLASRITASDGGATGWTWPATPTATARRAIRTVPPRITSGTS